MSSIETSSNGRSLKMSMPSATSCSRRASVLRRARRGAAMRGAAAGRTGSREGAASRSRDPTAL
jgi:hypothetical protein